MNDFGDTNEPARSPAGSTPDRGERADLQDTAREYAHWRGTVDTRLDSHSMQLSTIGNALKELTGVTTSIDRRMAEREGGEVVGEKRTASATTWRMWAIALGVTVVLGFFSMAITVAIFLLTR